MDLSIAEAVLTAAASPVKDNKHRHLLRVCLGAPFRASCATGRDSEDYSIKLTISKRRR